MHFTIAPAQVCFGPVFSVFLGFFMAYSNISSAQTTLSPDSYVVLGLATCYLRQDGETTELQIIEPVPSAYLETLLTGVATSYSALYATTLAQALDHPKTGLAAGTTNVVHLCEDYTERLQATARSYVNRPSATELLKPETTFSELNFSLDSKRILNPKNKVSKSDNVKQHRYTHEVIS